MKAASGPPTESDLELAHALEREAATRQILAAINRSRDDEQPVFDVILENAARLCDAPFAGLYLVEEDARHARLAANLGARSEYLETALTRWPLDSEASVPRAITGQRVIHLEDLKDTQTYRRGDRQRVDAVEIEGIRTFLAVPLIGQDGAIGAIGLYRREVRRFAENQIALLETFAAQAVIAIENVRQFRELQNRLERERATRQILQVINGSRTDGLPVFEAILENAARLCKAPHAMLLMRNQADTHLEMVASNSAKSNFVERLRQDPHRIDNRGSIAIQALEAMQARHELDIRELRSTHRPAAQVEAAIELEGMRTVVAIPLIEGTGAIGVICLYKLEVSPFSEDEIELVRTFAAQAVIAIKNVNQYRELDARNREIQALNASLEARVAAQVGEIERMGRLKRFLPQQVADAVISAGDERLLASHRALIGILFCDIRGFTAFCETAEPEETIEVLQTYHEEMGALIAAHHGGVDHRMGDGIMVLFNDPLPCEDPAGAALTLAFAMRDRMAALCKDWRRLGHRLGFGVGISLGYATVGMVGSEGRYEYTASGTAVNLAARLCDEASDGEILLSPRAFAALEDSVETEPVGPLTLKGIRAPVDVHRVLGGR